MKVNIKYRDETLNLDLPDSATIQDLAQQCATHINAEIERISLFLLPTPGLLKHPFPSTPLSTTLTSKTRIKLIGTPSTEIKALDAIATQTRARSLTPKPKAPPASKNRDWRKIQEESTYTFHTITPLPYLPRPEKSLRFLQRLASDPGIKSSMRKHKFSVGLLTEMNPAEHTTHESRTLGLNRNAGEVIELRLRTDRYDGYRDYKVIRKTLCHELAHNVFGEHDRRFYDLMAEIEKEVEKGDWTRGGNRLSEEEFYNPGDEGEESVDHGAWTGGEFVLGRGKDGSGSGSGSGSEGGLSRREIMARAAESRVRKQREAAEGQESEP